MGGAPLTFLYGRGGLTGLSANFPRQTCVTSAPRNAAWQARIAGWLKVTKHLRIWACKMVDAFSIIKPSLT